MKIFYLLVTQPTNLGDLIINKMLINELTKYGNVYVDSHGIPLNFTRFIFNNTRIINFNEKYGCTLKRYSLFKAIQIIKREKFTHYFESPGPKKVQISVNSLAFLAIYILLKNAKLKINWIGIDLISRNKLLTSVFIKLVDNIYLRSKTSLTGSSEKINYIPDLSVLYKTKPASKSSNKVAISFRQTNGDFNIFIKDLKMLVREIRRMNYTVEIFYQVTQDYSFCKRIYDELKKSEEVSFVQKPIWYDNLIYYADKCAVLSNRLHVLLLAALYDSIPLALLDDDIKITKIRNVFNYFELDNYILHEPYENALSNMLPRVNFTNHIQYKLAENRILCKKMIKKLFLNKNRN